MRRATVLLTTLTLLLGAAAPAVAQEGSVGIVDTSTGEWYLLDLAGNTTRFFYGDPGDLPMVGDWDCDGDETPGLYRQSDGFVYLRNSNSQGVADVRFFFGNPGDIPLAGDFDGDGCDTVSIYRPSESSIHIINQLGANEGGLGAADFSYIFGNPGDNPYVGDFDDDTIDEVGLHRESTGLVYFRFSHTQGPADHSFIFGDPGDKIIAAEWARRDASGPETVGLFRPSTCTIFLRYTNTQGVADETMSYGVPTGLPVAGEFGLLPGGGTPPPGCPLAGTWVATDCAQWWEHGGPRDCSVWGDGSSLSLVIGSGQNPDVILNDSYSTACAEAGLPTDLTATGRGEYLSAHEIEVSFAAKRCGQTDAQGVLAADNVLFSHDLGGDTMWSDPDGDGWGHAWARVP